MSKRSVKFNTNEPWIMDMRQMERGMKHKLLDSVAREFPGREVDTPFGQFYLIRTRTEELSEAGKALSRFSSMFADDRHGINRITVRYPDDILFMDIETLGLESDAPMFLCGLLYFDGVKYVIDQLLARHIDEEAALLDYLAQELDEFGVIVTFNGESFDIPYIIDRMMYHGVELCCDLMERSYDLLLHARRKWRGLMPNFRLKTLEKEICGRGRVGDIDSADIPEAYLDFMASGNTNILKPILYHNRMDLVSMAEIIAALGE